MRHRHQADKGITTVDTNKTDKIREGQIQIDDEHNYKPVVEPIRGTQREYSSKPHKHSIVERTLVFKL